MNTKNLFLTIAAVILTAAGCRESVTPVLSVSEELLDFPAAGGEPQTFDVTANVLWSIGGKPGWLTIETVPGKGVVPVKVTAEANTSVARNCTLKITTADANVRDLEVVVRQDAVPPSAITIRKISGVAVPVTGRPPVNSITKTDEFTGSVAWAHSETGASLNGNFAANTSYTATITLTPEPGFTLADVPANFFSVEKAKVSNDAGRGVITAVFPATDVRSPDGQHDSPILVATASDLQKIGKDAAWTLAMHYRQIANIDLKSVNWTPIGEVAINPFSGSYNGDGYTIANLTISGATHGYGLFGYIGESGKVRNVALKNVNINSTASAVGGIVYYNYGTIENCYVTGEISGTNVIGGVAGLHEGEGALIKNCYTTCNVSGSSHSIGGIAGTSFNSQIENCYATGKISGTFYVGGIVGNVDPGCTVERCVALNPEVSASTTTQVGRITAYNEGTLRNNYARSDMTLKDNSGVVNLPVSPAPSTSDIHGANASEANVNNAAWWSNTSLSAPNFSTDLWSIANNRLPHLLTTSGGAFDEPQDPKVVNN